MLDYALLARQAEALTAGEPSQIANLANVAALLFDALDDVNWAGFYLLDKTIDQRGEELVLGPFQGKPACIRIPLGRGVCGTAFTEQRALVVADVHAFEGHIACDPLSRSEVVVPFSVNKQWIGVLDIDSPRTGRFSQKDATGLARVVAVLDRPTSRAQ